MVERKCLAILLAAPSAWCSAPLAAAPRAHADTADRVVSLPVRRLPSGATSWVSGALAVADVDGDGFDDVLISTRATVENGVSGPGVVRVFSGRTGESIRDIVATGSIESEFGTLVRAADLDGDGRAEIIVPSWRSAAPPSIPDGPPLALAGAVEIFSGATGELLYTLYGDSFGAGLGRTLDLTADLDADGAPELLVGAPGRSDGSQQIGGLRIFSGRTGALLRAGDAATLGQAGRAWLVADLGDVNMDGVRDIVSATISTIFILSTDDLRTLRTIPAGHLGTGAIAPVGDTDGDGADDCLVGVPQGVFVFSGRTGETLLSLNTPAMSVAGLRDLDDDGRPDIALHDWQNDMVRVISGADGRTILAIVSPRWGRPDSPVAQFGMRIEAGDTNNDGAQDIVVCAAALVDPPGAALRAYIFSSAPCPGDAAPDRAADFRDLNAVLADYGRTGALLGGDLNADLVVDMLDLNEMLTVYGRACAPVPR